MVEYFVPVKEGVYIPSISAEGVVYTRVSAELWNEAVLSGAMSCE